METNQIQRGKRDLPELAFQDTRSADILAKRVKALGFDVTTGVGKTGLVALLWAEPGRHVAHRTGCLPTEEKTAAAFASTATARDALADPNLRPLRSEPCLRAVLAKLGLPD